MEKFNFVKDAHKKLVDRFNLVTICWILIAGVMCVVLVSSLVRDFNHDEFEKVHTGWKVLHGEKIYEDFFQHSHPFFFYYLALLIKIFGETTLALILLRLSILLMLILILIITYRLGLMVYGKKAAYISILLLGSAQIFTNRAIEIRPDVSQTMFGLLSLYLLLLYFENRSLKYLFLSSFSLAISFLILQKAIFLMALVGCLLAINVYKKQISYRDFFTFPLVFLLVLVPYFIYLICSDSLWSYFTFNWLINTKFARRFSAFNSFGFALRTSTLLCIFYYVGLRYFTKTPNQKRVGWFSLGLLGSTFLAFAPYKQYFMIAMPLVAIISAGAIHAIFERKPGLMLLVLFFAVVVPTIFLLIRAGETNKSQLQTVKYVLSITDEDDFVYDGNSFFNVFRKDIDFFWFSLRPRIGGLDTYKTMADYKYDIYESIEKYRPKVISNYQIENMEDYSIAEHYKESEQHKGLFVRID